MGNEKQEYVEIRNSFQRLKQSELEKIDLINEQIANLESAKRTCCEVIKENIPKTNHGERICPKCDCVSMKYLGRLHRGKFDRGDDFYICEICDYEEDFMADLDRKIPLLK